MHVHFMCIYTLYSYHSLIAIYNSYLPQCEPVYTMLRKKHIEFLANNKDDMGNTLYMEEQFVKTNIQKLPSTITMSP